MPAHAGIQSFHVVKILWIPVFTGTTTFYDFIKITEKDRREGIDLFCKGKFSIDSQGEVHPCEFLRGVRLGNIFEEELPGIIGRARAHPLIHAREQGFKGHIPLELSNHFDYHTGVCHRLAGLISGDT